MTLGLSEYECFVGLIAFVGLFNRLKMHSEKNKKANDQYFDLVIFHVLHYNFIDSNTLREYKEIANVANQVKNRYPIKDEAISEIYVRCVTSPLYTQKEKEQVIANLEGLRTNYCNFDCPLKYKIHFIKLLSEKKREYKYFKNDATCIFSLLVFLIILGATTTSNDVTDMSLGSLGIVFLLLILFSCLGALCMAVASIVADVMKEMLKCL